MFTSSNSFVWCCCSFCDYPRLLRKQCVAVLSFHAWRNVIIIFSHSLRKNCMNFSIIYSTILCWFIYWFTKWNVPYYVSNPIKMLVLQVSNCKHRILDTSLNIFLRRKLNCMMNKFHVHTVSKVIFIVWPHRLIIC